MAGNLDSNIANRLVGFEFLSKVPGRCQNPTRQRHGIINRQPLERQTTQLSWSRNGPDSLPQLAKLHLHADSQVALLHVPEQDIFAILPATLFFNEYVAHT